MQGNGAGRRVGICKGYVHGAPGPLLVVHLRRRRESQQHWGLDDSGLTAWAWQPSACSLAVLGCADGLQQVTHSHTLNGPLESISVWLAREVGPCRIVKGGGRRAGSRQVWGLGRLNLSGCQKNQPCQLQALHRPKRLQPSTLQLGALLCPAVLIALSSNSPQLCKATVLQALQPGPKHPW